MIRQIYKPESFPTLMHLVKSDNIYILNVGEINPLSDFFEKQGTRKAAKLDNLSNKKFKESWERMPNEMRLQTVKKFVEYQLKNRAGEMTNIPEFPGKRYFVKVLSSIGEGIIRESEFKELQPHPFYGMPMLAYKFNPVQYYVGLKLSTNVEEGTISLTRSIFVCYEHETRAACTVEYNLSRGKMIIHQDKTPYNFQYFVDEIMDMETSAVR